MIQGDVILFYLYKPIYDPAALVAAQEKLCKRLELKGRIRIACEGVNGTVGGRTDSIREYMEEVEKDENIGGGLIDWKVSKSSSIDGSHHFDKLLIRQVKEICSLGADVSLEKEKGGLHLTPTQWHKLLTTGTLEDKLEGKEKEKPLLVIDCRNTYESRIGHFSVGPEAISSASAQVVLPQTRNFSQFPRWLKDNKERFNFADKRVAMYCTGGIRCESASVLLKRMGVDEVYQLQSGIHRYLEEFPLTKVALPNGKKKKIVEQHGIFKGNNFVFDKRQTASPDGAATIIGQCEMCNSPQERYDRETGRCILCRSLVLVCAECLRNSWKPDKEMNAETIYLQPLYCSEHSEWRDSDLPFLRKKIESIKKEIAKKPSKKLQQRLKFCEKEIARMNQKKEDFERNKKVD
eukprot:g1338.t1